MSSASFHLAGKELVRIEQLMISVNGPSITSRQFLSMRAVTLSGPGDLTIGSDLTIRRTSSHGTDFRLKRPGVLELGLVSNSRSLAVMLFFSIRLCDVSAAFWPIFEKNWLNSLAMVDRSFV